MSTERSKLRVFITRIDCFLTIFNTFSFSLKFFISFVRDGGGGVGGNGGLLVRGSLLQPLSLRRGLLGKGAYWKLQLLKGLLRQRGLLET